jgi:glycine hydroxymethyltransferase
LVNLAKQGITGSKLEKVCELCDISLNKNTVPGDTNPMNPSGVRVGTAAMTTRGCRGEHMQTIAGFLERAIKITQDAQAKYGVKLAGFIQGLTDDQNIQALINELRLDVNLFSTGLSWYCRV